MLKYRIYHIINFFIASVWFVNGFLCKLLNLVPRHQEIVAHILGINHARLLTVLIGFSEVIVAVWILASFKSRLIAILQIIAVILMNILEFALVPDLLLWGKFNLFFALLFVLLIYYNEFILKPTYQQ